LNGFDGGKSGTLRITRNTYSGRAYGGIALFAQEGSIQKLLAASNGTGVSERCLLMSEPHLLGKRKHVNKPAIDESVIAEYNKIAGDLGRVSLNKQHHLCLSVTDLTISELGHFKITSYRDDIEEYLDDGKKYASHISLRGLAGKADMHIMKIAANLHLLDRNSLKDKTGNTGNLACFDTDIYQTAISDNHVISAIHIFDDLLKAALGLCHDKGITGTKAEYSAVISYLSNKKPNGATAREIINSLRTTHPFENMAGGKSQMIKKTIDEMVNEKLIVILDTQDSIYRYKVK
jgi:hypothetical protein